jgi:hypothetical protein
MGFRTILVFCVGPAKPKSYHDSCHHNGRLNLGDLPEWRWQDISAHLKCTKCGTVGYVDTRLDWGEVINFNKGIGRHKKAPDNAGAFDGLERSAAGQYGPPTL